VVDEFQRLRDAFEQSPISHEHPCTFSALSQSAISKVVEGDAAEGDILKPVQ
jgi:hypothetical protein